MAGMGIEQYIVLWKLVLYIISLQPKIIMVFYLGKAECINSTQSDSIGQSAGQSSPIQAGGFINRAQAEGSPTACLIDGHTEEDTVFFARIRDSSGTCITALTHDL